MNHILSNFAKILSALQLKISSVSHYSFVALVSDSRHHLIVWNCLHSFLRRDWNSYKNTAKIGTSLIWLHIFFFSPFLHVSQALLPIKHCIAWCSHLLASQQDTVTQVVSTARSLKQCSASKMRSSTFVSTVHKKGF